MTSSNFIVFDKISKPRLAVEQFSHTFSHFIVFFCLIVSSIVNIVLGRILHFELSLVFILKGRSFDFDQIRKVTFRIQKSVRS